MIGLAAVSAPPGHPQRTGLNHNVPGTLFGLMGARWDLMGLEGGENDENGGLHSPQ